MVVDSGSVKAVETALQALPTGNDTLLISTDDSSDEPAEGFSGTRNLMHTRQLLELGQQQCVRMQLQDVQDMASLVSVQETRSPH